MSGPSVQTINRIKLGTMIDLWEDTFILQQEKTDIIEIYCPTFAFQGAINDQSFTEFRCIFMPRHIRLHYILITLILSFYIEY
jgi:hypothetical protein